MNVEFFATAKYGMKLPEGVNGVAGGIILPSGLALHTLARRQLQQYPYLARRLFDPQLYLAGLPAAACRSACVNLASYGCFVNTPLPAYKSTAQRQHQWKQRAEARIPTLWRGTPPSSPDAIEADVRLCIQTQVNLDCEALILPSPLTVSPASDYATEVLWLDIGLDVARTLGRDLPRIATIAVSDTCLRGIPSANNALLDTIIDQVTARRPEGAYLVLEQAYEDGYYCTHPNTVGALLRLTSWLKSGGLSRVIVSFVGTAGLLALAVGADTWAANWYRGERRLRLADFGAEGRAFPAYYSHTLASEIHVDADLDRIVQSGLLDRIADQTPASMNLLRALRRGARASSVPEWRYRTSNVAAAREHFLMAVARETDQLARLSPTQRVDYVRKWLDGADKLASELYGIGPFNPRTALNHQSGWRSAFQAFLGSR